VRRDEALKILTDHREELQEFGVKRLAIFGSVARDEAGPESDVDVLVEFDKPVGIFEFLDLKTRLEELLGRPVDLATENGLKRQLRDRILEEAIPAS
jgi:predicted nucleotidyltransferase